MLGGVDLSNEMQSANTDLSTDVVGSFQSNSSAGYMVWSDVGQDLFGKYASGKGNLFVDRIIKSNKVPLITTLASITEALHLLDFNRVDFNRDAQLDFMEWVSRGGVEIYNSVLYKAQVDASGGANP